MSRVMSKKYYAYANTKEHVSAIKIVDLQSLYFLTSKFQASCHLLRLLSSICVEHCRKPQVRYSRFEAASTKLLDNYTVSPILKHLKKAFPPIADRTFLHT